MCQYHDLIGQKLIRVLKHMAVSRPAVDVKALGPPSPPFPPCPAIAVGDTDSLPALLARAVWRPVFTQGPGAAFKAWPSLRLWQALPGLLASVTPLGQGRRHQAAKTPMFPLESGGGRSFQPQAGRRRCYDRLLASMGNRGHWASAGILACLSLQALLKRFCWKDFAP